MNKVLFGDACAHCPGAGKEGKASYPRIGMAFKDGDRISIKLDSIPIPNSTWSGWINIFPRDRAQPPSPSLELAPDDVPF